MDRKPNSGVSEYSERGSMWTKRYDAPEIWNVMERKAGV
jgi:hypothetical protein